MIHGGRLFRRYFALIVSSAIGVYFSYKENTAALASLQREWALAAAAPQWLNLRTARAFGIQVLRSIPLRADRVIG